MKQPKELTLKELELIDSCIVAVINTYQNINEEIDTDGNLEAYPKCLDKICNRISKMIDYKEKQKCQH